MGAEALKIKIPDNLERRIEEISTEMGVETIE